MSTCSIEGCNWKHKAKGLCKNHYRQMMRGTLDQPRYSVSRPKPGQHTVWPFEFVKMGDDWFRRPTGSHDDWLPIVWPERGEDYSEPRARGYL